VVYINQNEIPPVIEKLARKEYTEKQATEDNLKRNMYDWVTGSGCQARPPHSALNWVRCRWDNPTVCSYDNGVTWHPRPAGATFSHPGQEDGCNCEAPPYRIEHRVDLKIKAPMFSDKPDNSIRDTEIQGSKSTVEIINSENLHEAENQGSKTSEQRHNTILKDMIPQIKKSPYFKSEKKQILIDMLKKTSKLHDPFSYDDRLTATEKKALGFNSRLRISRQMIDFLNEEGLKRENPKEIISTTYYDIYSKYEAEWDAVDKKELYEKFKKSALENRKCMESLGLTMYIWETSGDERVCPSCRKMDEKLCKWDDPTVYSRNKGKDWIPRPKGAPLTHPGEKEGCRCTAISYYDELVGEV
jgi:hypothetical protein